MSVSGTGSLGTSGEDASLAADVATFHEDLIALRANAGAPSYARLARRIGQPRSTVYDAFRRSSLPALDLLIALVTALSGDADAWRERWTVLRARTDSTTASTGEAADVPADPPVRTGSDAGGRPSRGWWALFAGAVLVAAGAAVLLTAVLVSGGDDGCTPYRVYRVTAEGALLDAHNIELSRTSAGDVVIVSNTRDTTYDSRYYAIDLATGKAGYVDQSKIDFVQDHLCL